jgi:hypothetical protein
LCCLFVRMYVTLLVVSFGKGSHANIRYVHHNAILFMHFGRSHPHSTPHHSTPRTPTVGAQKQQRRRQQH